MGSITDNLDAGNVITIKAQPAETNQGTTLSGVFNLPAIRPMASFRRLWTNYYPRRPFGEEAVIMPGSALNFVITGLLCFAEIKSQGQAKFPFQTHPQVIMVAITSLLMYGLASAAEEVICAARPAPTSVYTVIARWGKMVFVYILEAQGTEKLEINTSTTTKVMAKWSFSSFCRIPDIRQL